MQCLTNEQSAVEIIMESEIYVIMCCYQIMVVIQVFEWLCMINIITSYELRDIKKLMQENKVKSLRESIAQVKCSFQGRTQILQMRFQAKEQTIKYFLAGSLVFLLILFTVFPIYYCLCNEGVFAGYSNSY